MAEIIPGGATGEARSEASEPTLEADIEPIPIHKVVADVEAINGQISEVRSKVYGVESRVQALEEAIKEIVEDKLDFDKFLEVAKVIGGWKKATCRYQRGGVCYAWRVRGNTTLGPVVDDNGTPRLRIDDAPYVCSLCPLYEPATRRLD